MFIPAMIIPYTLSVPRPTVSLILVVYIGFALMGSITTGKKILDAGWGQRHGFSGTSAMSFLSLGTLPDIPSEYILIYAPRTEAEVKTVMDIVAAGVKFMTGREDVR
jgi:hypothetical protein